jgi:hypothetical protein
VTCGIMEITGTAADKLPFFHIPSTFLPLKNIRFLPSPRGLQNWICCSGVDHRKVSSLPSGISMSRSGRWFPGRFRAFENFCLDAFSAY